MSLQRNAIILAAGTSSRFVPLSIERPKGLLEVKGEVLIERQIRQLKEAGVHDITVVVGFKAQLFGYLKEKYHVSLVYNQDYDRYNNTSSLMHVLDKLGNTYICSSDNYFPRNVFLSEESESFYSAMFAKGDTSEYCIETNSASYITGVKVGGRDSWYMIGHVFFNEEFSRRFSDILEKEYKLPDTKNEYWEDVYIRHIDELPMKIKKYNPGDVLEFDSLDELRSFDDSYIDNTRSSIVKEICKTYGWEEKQLDSFQKMEQTDSSIVFGFYVNGVQYIYNSTNVNKVTRL